MTTQIPISAVTSSTPSTASQQAAARQVTGDTLGKDAFMKLLVAQLKYQNPLQPTDPSSFMAQTAQMTMVEKLTQLADTAQTQSLNERSLTAASLIGRTIDWKATDGTDHTGTCTGTRFTSDGPVLVIGSSNPPTEVPLGEVTAVKQTAG